MSQTTTTKTIYWHVLGQNAGQIVTEHQPQICGASEGAEGRGKGLRLFTDASDMTWWLVKGKKTIAEGSYCGQNQLPTVDEALAMFRKAR